MNKIKTLIFFSLTFLATKHINKRKENLTLLRLLVQKRGEEER